MQPIQMVDLRTQYLNIKSEIDTAIQQVIDQTAFIGGPAVQSFSDKLAEYLGAKHVIPCANGTDALQIALMALELQPGDEVIVPAFTYVATAEVIALLQLQPVMVDCDPHTFNVRPEDVEKAITPKTKAVVPVHLFGQACDMEGIMAVANKHHIYVVEDNAQAIGADFTWSDGRTQKTGTIGHIGCTSFYPSKNLGCYGDGGAISTNDDALAHTMRMIANHGQQKRYYHDIIGCNSRLDGIQAAILGVKLNYLDNYARARQNAADWYDAALKNIPGLTIPVREKKSSHVFHQYTLQVADHQRDALQQFLQEKGIPTMIYYPVPLYQQEAFKKFAPKNLFLPTTHYLCESVISLPMHTELNSSQLKSITDALHEFFALRT